MIHREAQSQKLADAFYAYLHKEITWQQLKAAKIQYAKEEN